MCLFSTPIQIVCGTRIFARMDGDRQALIYDMDFASDQETAMVLPIPIASGSGEDAVEFVNLEGCPEFFDKLDRLFRPMLIEAAGLDFEQESHRVPISRL